MEERYARVDIRIRLHDVSPLTWDGCVEWIELCSSLGLPPIDLFVIPRHEGGPSHRGAGLPPEFVAKLNKLHKAGHALWIHGWSHRGPDGEAEFAGMGAVGVVNHARRALLDWREAKLPDPAGFCPPCWVMPGDALPGLFQLGFAQVDLRLGVARPGSMERSIALSTWGGTSLFARAWNRTIPWQRRLFSAFPMRIALHPQDIYDKSRLSMERVLASFL